MICGFKTNATSKIKRHLLVFHHHKEKSKDKYKCAHCEFKTGQSLFIAKHAKSMHGSDELLHKCSICHHTAFTLQNLRAHKNSVHLRIPLACNHCDYYASSKADSITTKNT